MARQRSVVIQVGTMAAESGSRCRMNRASSRSWLAEGTENDLIEKRTIRLGPNMQAWLLPSGDDHVLLPERLRNATPGMHMQSAGSNVYHSAVQDTPSGRLYVDYDATENEAFVYEFGGFLSTKSGEGGVM